MCFIQPMFSNDSFVEVKQLDRHRQLQRQPVKHLITMPLKFHSIHVIRNTIFNLKDTGTCMKRVAQKMPFSLASGLVTPKCNTLYTQRQEYLMPDLCLQSHSPCPQTLYNSYYDYDSTRFKSTTMKHYIQLLVDPDARINRSLLQSVIQIGVFYSN